ncbi:MAG TPA: hypothetical protein VOB72_20380 [Candidatus Dormibacteraeota bacterium]|nr:hypothetical protein [Candidatus Dormibacteraeota bacterium]
MGTDRVAIGEREWDDPGQLDNLVRLFRAGLHEPATGPLRFFVAGPLQPGDPLQVSCLAQAPVEDGWVEVSVGGHLLETLHLPALVAGTAGRVRPPGGTAGARALYQVGPKRLTFKATGSHGSVCQQTAVTVAAPDVASWWAWRWPEPERSCYWRTTYRVGGELTNLGAGAVRIVRAAFEETAPDGATRRIEDVRLSAAELPAHGVASVLCEPRQAWDWASWSTAPGGEDYVRRFAYDLDVELEDEFGNRSSLRTSLQDPVAVLISPRKRNWWRAEAALRGAAIALLVRATCRPSEMATDLAYRIFGAGAMRGRRGIAERIHEMVMAPPSPDPGYGARVSWPRRLAVEEVISGELGWADRVVVEAVIGLEFLVALHEAIAEVEGKWLGARLADDAEGMRNQRADLLDLLRLTHEEWARASYRIGDLRAGQAQGTGEEEVPYRFAEWQASGVPAAILEDWERQGVPARWIEDVMVAGGGLLWTAEGVLGYVRRSLEAALFATRDLLTANPEVGPTEHA